MHLFLARKDWVMRISYLSGSVQDNTNMRQVCLCIEADDVFHAKWEHAATHHHHNAVAHMYGQ